MQFMSFGAVVAGSPPFLSLGGEKRPLGQEQMAF